MRPASRLTQPAPDACRSEAAGSAWHWHKLCFTTTGLTDLSQLVKETDLEYATQRAEARIC
jgi:hypothetical protein